MKYKNVYWFAGDRFSCISQKDSILESLRFGDSKWSIRDVTKMKANQIFAIINSNPLFGDTNIIMICDGKLPEPDKMLPAISKMPDDRVFIIIDPKIDKRSKVYKGLKENIEIFESALSKDGIDKGKIKSVGEYIKKKYEWNGSNEAFNDLFKICGYDIGITACEIEKINIYKSGEAINDISEIEEILCSNECPDIDDLILDVFSSDIEESLFTLEKIMSTVDLDSYAFKFFNTIIDRLLMITYGCLAYENGIESMKDISNIVALRMEKDGKKVHSYYVLKKLLSFEHVINSIPSRKVLSWLSRAREAIDDHVNKRGSNQFLMRRFVFNGM